jgi:hypothetical protein
MSKEDGIECPILYEYFKEGGIQNEHRDGSDYYTHPQTDRINEIASFFDKKVLHWFISYEDMEVYPSPQIPDLILHWNLKK